MPQGDLTRRYETAMRRLEAAGQAHVLTFYDRLDDTERNALLTQIEAQDWDRLKELVSSYVVNVPKTHLPSSIEPAPFYPAEPTGVLASKYADARRAGESMIREGKVAAFTVAGGQGTRLGWDGPKGTFPASPVHRKPLFQLFAESILKTRRKYDAPVPWYIMTSQANDAETRAFFETHGHFGLGHEDVMFFQQGAIPSFAMDGTALLASPSQIAANPDGHGGSLKALHASGAIADMKRRGVERISYFQVDNPLVKCVDPLFLGLHGLDGARMSSKMVAKAHAGEKVGVFALVDKKINVIEYSDLPAELNDATNEDGSLRFNAGSIAIHVLDVAFVEQLNAGAFALPWHRAVKKVPHIDLRTGRLFEPSSPNAVKLETFVFDALMFCDKSIVLETPREEEFGPIKNAEGADSPATSKALQSDRSARWLETVGVAVPKSNGRYTATIELSPLTAVEPEDLHAAKGLPKVIEPSARIAV